MQQKNHAVSYPPDKYGFQSPQFWDLLPVFLPVPWFFTRFCLNFSAYTEGLALFFRVHGISISLKCLDSIDSMTPFTPFYPSYLELRFKLREVAPYSLRNAKPFFVFCAIFWSRLLAIAIDGGRRFGLVSDVDGGGGAYILHR